MSDDVGAPLRVVVAPVRAVVQPLVAGLGELVPVTITVGEEVPFTELVHRLADAAYARVDMVTHRGEFAVRGGILDVFPPTEDHPIRVEFFGDEVDQMRWFSVADQRSLTAQRQCTHPTELYAPPCREILITPSVMSRAAKLKDQHAGRRRTCWRRSPAASPSRAWNPWPRRWWTPWCRWRRSSRRAPSPW